MPPAAPNDSGSFVLGIDVGGTFADIICIGPDFLHMRKSPSRPDDPGEDVLEGIAQVADDLGLDGIEEMLGQCALIIHGSTVATNLLLTATGPPVGLITTAGFRDIVEMRGGVRESTFDSHLANAAPLAPRRFRCEIDESTNAGGHVVRRPELRAVRKAVLALRDQGVKSLAIALKHSAANPENEAAIAEVCEREYPELFVSTSASLTRRPRLYDRTSTAVVNAYVGISTSRYIGRLLDKLLNLGFKGQLLIMAGNGGLMSSDQARRMPVNMVLSGPSAGPTAAVFAAGSAGTRTDGIVIDMGGTSFDVSVVRGGSVAMAASRDVNRYRLAVPMLDIHTIGAGGGSLAWIDDVGLLRVGPQSAGAVPGPAAYEQGGMDATVTDANLVLGLLDPEAVLGGARKLSLPAARRAVGDIARRLSLPLEEAALGIRQVANGAMTAAIREVTLGRGLDPREMPLIAGGGAGPLHAADLATALGIRAVVVPWQAGVLCALGMAVTDVRYEAFVGVVAPLAEIDLAVVRQAVELSAAELNVKLAEIGDQIGTERTELELEARYMGQFHELVVPAIPDELDDKHRDALAARFHDAHEDAYGFRSADAPVEIVGVRVRRVGSLTRRPSRLPAHRDGPLSQVATRLVHGERRQRLTRVPVYRAAAGAKRAGVTLGPGPALVDLPTTTVFVPANWSWRTGDSQDLILETDGSRWGSHGI